MVVLPAPVGPDDGDRLSRFGGEGDVLQHRHVVFIAVRDVVEFDFADDLGQILGARLVLHRGHLIQQSEDAFRACDRVLHIGPQHRDLLRWAG